MPYKIFSDNNKNEILPGSHIKYNDGSGDQVRKVLLDNDKYSGLKVDLDGRCIYQLLKDCKKANKPVFVVKV